MPKAERPDTRFGYVELLFALTAAEIAIQFADVITKVDSFGIAVPAYCHLVLALILVTTSWVGWSKSNAPGARRDVKWVFSADFIVLIIDVLLVILYFIVVKGVDVHKTPDGAIKILPSAYNESLCLVFVFAGYLLWDVLTKAVIVDANTRKVIGFEFLNKEFRERGRVSAFCLLLAIIAWYVVKDVASPTHVMLADLTLIALVLFFRAIKQPAPTWIWISGICFVVPLGLLRLVF